ncbi:MAG: ChbG/HpnK family deacetylase [Herbinix sp.]|jgi:predicted glycoside hydrolase/deacetylase ChbG (UPF0249 family)|nr:ChbG/HpnK family deacetylase [Herbinix sp.]
MSRNDRYLIINADDFGICTETNIAIEHLFREGRITSTTVMVCAQEAKAALMIANHDNRIKMGLHSTFNSDFTSIPWKSASGRNLNLSFVDAEGNFPHDLREFYQRAERNEVIMELEAQYQLIKETGYNPTHMDSHCGALYGLTGKSFLKEALEFCSKHQLPFRFPKSKRYLQTIFGKDLPASIEESHGTAVCMAKRCQVALPDDIITNPWNVTEIGSYERLKEFYLKTIIECKDGITELFLHPSMENKQFVNHTKEWQKRIWEYQFLLDEDFMQVIRKEEIKLVSWSDAPFHWDEY